MSKQRARERAARESAARVRAEQRRVEAERAARRRARLDRALAPIRRLRLALTSGRQTGPLALKRRARMRLILAVLLFAQVLVWTLRPDWQARLAALVIAALAFPVIAAFAA